MPSTRVATRVNSRPFFRGREFFAFLERSSDIKEELKMLDLKYVRNNFEEVKRVLQFRGEDLSDLGKFEDLDVKRRTLIADTEKLKSQRNEVSQQVAVLKR